MKAIAVYETGGPDVLHYEDVPNPVARPGEILVRIAAAGINFIDVYRRTGLYSVPLPFIPGTEAAGTVTALGDGVTGFAVGDHVAYEGPLGAYAELQAVPIAKAVMVPDGIKMDVAAAVMKLRGARVFGTVSTPAKAEIARGYGVDQAIQYTTQNFMTEVKRLTDGRGVDVVYDSVGKTTFDGSLDCLRPRGCMVLFGASSGPVPPLDPQILNRKGSLYLTRPTLGNYIATREEMVGRANDLFQWIKAGRLNVRIAQEFRLSDAAEAQRALESRRFAGKLLLVP